MAEKVKIHKQKSKWRTAFKITGICGYVVLLLIVILLTVNSLLSIFLDNYYPTFGSYRLFAITTDSMAPEIPTGDIIIGSVPENESDIEVGMVITYESRQGESIELVTNRVTEINVSEAGVTSYIMHGANAQVTDSINPTFDDVVGVYTGNKCGLLGYVFGFSETILGAVTLISILFILIISAVLVYFINLVKIWRKLALTAIKGGNIIKNAEEYANPVTNKPKPAPVVNKQFELKVAEPVKVQTRVKACETEEEDSGLITVGQLLGEDSDDSDDDEIQLEFLLNDDGSQKDVQSLEDLLRYVK